jgi:succinate dehydrogenase / fumarate reductase flavoprotein subunit
MLARDGINADLGPMDPEDNWRIHVDDILKKGEFLAEYKRVEILCNNASDTLNESVNWVANFHREKNGSLTVL